MKAYDVSSDMTKALLMELSLPTVYWNDERRERQKEGRSTESLLQ